MPFASTQPAPETVDSDEFILEEKRQNARRQLAALRPDFDEEQWRLAARQQLLHWLKWVHVVEHIQPHFQVAPKNHRLGIRAVFAAFFCYEPQGTAAYDELPLLMALLEGNNKVAQEAAARLGSSYIQRFWRVLIHLSTNRFQQMGTGNETSLSSFAKARSTRTSDSPRRTQSR
ncbi:MAG: hypothetical protein GY822_16205 [Deltaproteobacteria bacterium]|nr:hypothetical protein [Deltaproteobacteria bacterium]